MYNLIVSKFGGSVNATAEGVRKAIEIIKSDPARRYIIASAPGTSPEESGITDMLFMCHSSFQRKENYQEILKKISIHYQKILDAFDINFDLESEIKNLEQNLISDKEIGFIASRGEYIMGKILAKLLNYKFVDASELIFFNQDGTLNEALTLSAANTKLKNINYAVIPGFYGSMPDGKIKTFPRGDGDSSGAIIARSVHADLFEKWSEVIKVFSADSEIIPNPRLVKNMTYNEALELNYIRKNIARDIVILMLQEAGIPLRIGSIHEDEGTLISSILPEKNYRNFAACITWRRNFKMLHIEKYGLNQISGFGEKLLGIFAEYGAACEHCLSGIHNIALVIKSPRFDLRHNEIIHDINQVIEPESIIIEKDLSLITIIGEGMSTEYGRFEKIFSALSKEKINVKMLDQGSDANNIILGVSDNDLENAVKALYEIM